MKTLLLSVLFSGFLLSNPAWSQTCEGSCMNLSGTPAYDSFCDSIGKSGGGKEACNQYESLGCAWIIPSSSRGTCYNAGYPENDAICTHAGVTEGARGCAKYKDLGCVWVPAPGSCSK
ncbi:hypothetical protein [Bdellovibrio bacteriovorus]|uniref:hypothetical protein n=1 Tax=Bdellovibrio bacteriovorus TaxID=959 RepID=UPI0035A684B5